MAALELLGVLPIEVVGELYDRLGLIDVVLGKATAERLLHELSLRRRKVVGHGRLPGRAVRWLLAQRRREEDIRDEVPGEPAAPLSIHRSANLIRQWCGARQRLLQLGGLVGVQPLLGEVGVAREPLELCDERVRSASLREGDGEQKTAAVPRLQRCSISSTTAEVSISASASAASELLVEQREQRRGGLLVSGTAEGERGDPPFLGLAVLGDANQALTHGADRDAGRERDHLQMLGRRGILERPHDVLAHLEPAVWLEWQPRQRIEDGEPCRRRVVAEGIDQRPRLRGARCRWESSRCSHNPPSPEPALYRRAGNVRRCLPNRGW